MTATEERAVSETFNFHGQTTFINRPVDTVIRDFQNQYVSGADEGTREILNQLEELIRLMLSSKDLQPDQAEDAVQAVHNVAEQIKGKKGSRLTLKGTLQAVQAVVSRAADIAGPAAAIVTAVLSLLAL
jgi:hypothetical protein